MIADKQIHEMNDSDSKLSENSDKRTKTYSWIVFRKYDENHVTLYYHWELPYLLNYQN